MRIEEIRQGDIPGVQVRCRRELVLPPEAAWSWLVEPEKLRRWLADEVSVDLRPEGGGLVLESTFEGQPLDEKGSTLAFEPPRRWMLAFERDAGWTATHRLTFELTPHALGSELSVLQHGFQQLQLSSCMTVWELYRRRWRAALDRLAAASAEGAAGGNAEG